MSVMRPYLTCKWILAPFSTLSFSTPVALISRVWPLYESIKLAYDSKGIYVRWVIIAEEADAEAALLLNLDSVRLESSQWNGVEIAYAFGGLGDKSMESISRMSVGGFEQKKSGFSPGTSTLSSFTEIWFPLSQAETVAVRTTGRRSEASFIVKRVLLWENGEEVEVECYRRKWALKLEAGSWWLRWW